MHGWRGRRSGRGREGRRRGKQGQLPINVMNLRLTRAHFSAEENYCAEVLCQDLSLRHDVIDQGGYGCMTTSELIGSLSKLVDNVVQGGSSA